MVLCSVLIRVACFSAITTLYMNCFSPSQSAAMVRARILYERLVSNFPTSGRYWRLYVEQEVTFVWITISSLHCAFQLDACRYSTVLSVLSIPDLGLCLECLCDMWISKLGIVFVTLTEMIKVMGGQNESVI